MASDPQNATGRSRPAQAPIAPTVTAELPANVFAESMPAAAASPGESASAPSIGLTASRARFTIPPAPAAPTGEPHPQSDEEQTLLALLRLIDRVIGPGTLSPVERALVAGAKIMFDQLSKECRELLKRKPADLTRPMTPPGQTPLSVGNAPVPCPQPEERAATGGRRKTRVKPDRTPGP
jgi:hypothetical protein